ncbi:MAG TPA: NAD(P)H-binding protein [Conexibacter sp.]|nr:NAD(P)H-binding protein [Conexibacter sp.]
MQRSYPGSRPACNPRAVGERTPSIPTVLLTGATGYVGGRLLPLLARDGSDRLRALVRAPQRAPEAVRPYAVRGDAVSGEGLDAALDGVDVAYYLIHSMGSGSRHPDPDADFAARDRRAAETFGAAAARAGVRRVVYLGGLSGDNSSEHLRSREEVAQILARHVPQFVHVRAAMVIGAGGASFEMLRALVERLPAMVCPRWIDTRTQPIALADVVQALHALRDRPDVTGDVELGGADVLSYREMMVRTARVLGRRPPLVVRVPVLTPRLSSYWVQLVTPVDAGLVRPLVDGLREEMVVRTPPPPGINDAPLGFDDAVRAALSGR